MSTVQISVSLCLTFTNWILSSTVMWGPRPERLEVLISKKWNLGSMARFNGRPGSAVSYKGHR